MTSKFTLGAVFAALWLACGAQAKADQLTFNGADLFGVDKAKAVFDLTGTTLTITLTNTTEVGGAVPQNVLTGLGFNSQGATITPFTSGAVTMPSGTTTPFGSTTHDPGDGWAYKTAIDFHGYNLGISAAGLDPTGGDGGLFGPNGNLGPHPVKTDGLAYGILPFKYTSANTGITKSSSSPLYHNSLQFHFNVSGTFTLGKLYKNGVIFQFGTSLDEPFFPGVGDADPNVTPVPEPSSLALLGLGGIGLAIKSVRRRRQQAA